MLDTFSQQHAAMMEAAQGIAREWMQLAREGLQRNMLLFDELARSQTLPDAAEVQSRILRDNMDTIVRDTLRIVELAVKAAQDANATRAGLRPERSSLAHGGEPRDYGADNG